MTEHPHAFSDDVISAAVPIVRNARRRLIRASRSVNTANVSASPESTSAKTGSLSTKSMHSLPKVASTAIEFTGRSRSLRKCRSGPCRELWKNYEVADMPRFTYKVDGKLDEIVQNDAKFKAFSNDLRRDTESVLAQYDIADKAMLRQELGVILRLDFLEGRYDDALKVAARIRELE